MCPSKICKSVSYQLVVGGCRQLVSVCGQLAGRVFPPAVTYQLSQDARRLETQDGSRAVTSISITLTVKYLQIKNQIIDHIHRYIYGKTIQLEK